MDLEDMMDRIESLKNRLSKIEAKLSMVRGASPLTHGWQTQRLAKAQRKWDELAKIRIEIINEIEEFNKMDTTKRIRKLQSKVEPELEKHVKQQEDFSGMSDYIRIALIQKSRFKRKKAIK